MSNEKSQASLKQVAARAIGLIVAVFALGAGALIWSLQANSSLRTSLQDQLRAERLANVMKQSSEDLTDYIRLYAMTGDRRYRDAYFHVLKVKAGEAARPSGEKKSFDAMVAEIDLTDAERANLLKSSELSANLVKLETELMEYTDAWVKSNARPRDLEEQQRRLFDDGYMGEVKKIMAPVGEFEDSLLTRSADRVQQTQAQASMAKTILISVGALMLLLVGGTIALLIRQVYVVVGGEPNDLLVLLKQVAAGNLSTKIEARRPGSVFETLRETLSRVRDVISKVQQTSEIVSGISSEVSSSSSNIATGTGSQAASVEEVSASLEELKASIEQTSESARSSNETAQLIQQESKDGAQAVRDTVRAMQEIAQRIDVIEDIARNTNILALNADIEAARVGPAGRGFAVVASEVRKLAVNSAEAAREITEITKSSVSRAEEAQQAIEEMVPKMQDSARLSQQISQASQEQNSGADQINSAMRQLDSVVQQNAGASEGLAAMSEDLLKRAREMNEAAGYFRIDDKAGHAPVQYSPAPSAPEASSFAMEHTQDAGGSEIGFDSF